MFDNVLPTVNRYFKYLGAWLHHMYFLMIHTYTCKSYFLRTFVVELIAYPSFVQFKVPKNMCSITHKIHVAFGFHHVFLGTSWKDLVNTWLAVLPYWPLLTLCYTFSCHWKLNLEWLLWILKENSLVLNFLLHVPLHDSRSPPSCFNSRYYG